MEIYLPKQIGLADGATELVSVEDAKAWAAIDTVLDDTVVGSIIVAAREMVETFISKDVISKQRVLYIDRPEYDGEKYMVFLPYTAKESSVVVTAGTTTLTVDTDYEFVGIEGDYIQFSTLFTDITISYNSDPIVSPSELSLANAAVKVLIEQIYDNRANLEGDSDILILDENVKQMLIPIKMIYA
jgi:uncharacterized phiE125 gp8 family phage protein